MLAKVTTTKIQCERTTKIMITINEPTQQNVNVK